MNDILQSMIEQGGDFGILCVTLILITSVIIKYEKKIKSANTWFVYWLKTLRILFVICATAIFVLKVYITIDSSYMFDNKNEVTDSIQKVDVSKIDFDKTIEISERYKMTFSKPGIVRLTDKKALFWIPISYDTLYTGSVLDLKGFKIFEFENVMYIYFHGQIPSLRIQADKSFKMQDFLLFIKKLQNNGIAIQVKIKAYHIATVISVLLFLLAVYLFMLANTFSDGCFGHFIIGVLTLLISLIVFLYPRF